MKNLSKLSMLILIGLATNCQQFQQDVTPPLRWK